MGRIRPLIGALLLLAATAHATEYWQDAQNTNGYCTAATMSASCVMVSQSDGTEACVPSPGVHTFVGYDGTTVAWNTVAASWVTAWPTGVLEGASGALTSFSTTPQLVVLGAASGGGITQSTNLSFDGAALYVGSHIASPWPSLRASDAATTVSTLRSYPASGTNVADTFQIIPRGTGTGAVTGELDLFNTDAIASSVNYELLEIQGQGSLGYIIASAAGGTGTVRQIAIGTDSAGAPKQCVLQTSGAVAFGAGNVLLNKTGAQSVLKSGGAYTDGTSDANTMSLVTNGTTALFLDTSQGITAPALGGGGTQCVQVDNTGKFGVTGSACGTGSGSGGITQLTGDVTAGPGSGSQTATVHNLPDGTTQAGKLVATAIAAPAAPSAGTADIYVDSTSGNICEKTSAGIVNHGIRSTTATAGQYVTSFNDDGTSNLGTPTGDHLVLTDGTDTSPDYLANKVVGLAPVQATVIGSSTPPSTGLQLRLRADLGVTTSGSNVTAWADQSGNGFNVASTGSPPTLVASSINSLPAIHFAGASFLINTTANPVAAGAARTLVIVAKNATDYAGAPFAFRTASNGFNALLGIAGTFFYYASAGHSWNISNPAIGGTPVEAEWFSTGAGAGALSFAINGTTKDSGELVENDNGTTGFVVGQRCEGTQQYSGDIAEILVYDHVLSSGDLATLRGYVQTRYAITIVGAASGRQLQISLAYDNASLTVNGSNQLQRGALSGDVSAPAGSNVTTLNNIPNGTTAAGDINFTPITAPATPAAGHALVYVDSTSKNLAVKNDGGTVSHGIQTATCGANTWASATTDAGGLTCTQPSFSNLSGALGCSQLPAFTGDVANAACFTKVVGVTDGGGTDWPTSGAWANGQLLTLASAHITSETTLACSQAPALTGDVSSSAGSCSVNVTALENDALARGDIAYTPIAAPSSPASGSRCYADSTTGAVSCKNSSGTVTHGSITYTCSTSQWARSESGSGTVSCTQPGFSDLAGSATCSQLPALTGDITTSAGSCATTNPSKGKVLVSASDSTPDYLANKVQSSSGSVVVSTISGTSLNLNVNSTVVRSMTLAWTSTDFGGSHAGNDVFSNKQTVILLNNITTTFGYYLSAAAGTAVASTMAATATFVPWYSSGPGFNNATLYVNITTPNTGGSGSGTYVFELFSTTNTTSAASYTSLGSVSVTLSAGSGPVLGSSATLSSIPAGRALALVMYRSDTNSSFLSNEPLVSATLVATNP